MERKVTLEAEEWYVLANWLRERENRLQYALRSRSREWAFVHDLRLDIERQRGEASGSAGSSPELGRTDGPGVAAGAETRGTTRTVTLTDRQVAYLASFLRKRARRLLLRPWRDRERRDVRHLRDHLLAAAEGAERADRGTGIQREE
ncbi:MULTISPECIES: hypothetical protein [Halorussus]|uniref:hypothetical protein n=1 Tax=Halorussus TaxID=1070314 RepID=UPI000E21252B|nr:MULTISPECIES: hypothetical protein [Halorussus]NHN57791.1 hypothetical protein [Halorussus sp. JP-T4]